MIRQSIRLSSRLARQYRSIPRFHPPGFPQSSPAAVRHVPQVRGYVTKTPIDEKIEDLQDLYATAKDEFDIASEETDKQTVYAADDRAAAQDELAKLKEAFQAAVLAEGGEEIQRRIGQRIRELDNAVTALEERAMEQ